MANGKERERDTKRERKSMHHLDGDGKVLVDQLDPAV